MLPILNRRKHKHFVIYRITRRWKVVCFLKHPLNLQLEVFPHYLSACSQCPCRSLLDFTMHWLVYHPTKSLIHNWLKSIFKINNKMYEACEQPLWLERTCLIPLKVLKEQQNWKNSRRVFYMGFARIIDIIYQSLKDAVHSTQYMQQKSIEFQAFPIWSSNRWLCYYLKRWYLHC